MRISIIKEHGDSEQALGDCFSRVKTLYGDEMSIAINIGETETLTFDELEMNPVLHTVVRSGSPVELNPLEFRLLEYLLRRRGSDVSRHELMQNVWHYSFDPTTNILETCVSRLRSKIHDTGARRIVHTVRGVGYRVG